MSIHIYNLLDIFLYYYINNSLVFILLLEFLMLHSKIINLSILLDKYFANQNDKLFLVHLQVVYKFYSICLLSILFIFSFFVFVFARFNLIFYLKFTSFDFKLAFSYIVFFFIIFTAFLFAIILNTYFAFFWVSIIFVFFTLSGNYKGFYNSPI